MSEHAISPTLRGEIVFLYAMPGTAPVNADWARRKRTVVEWLHRPSCAIGLEIEQTGRSPLDAMGLPTRGIGMDPDRIRRLLGL